MINFDTTKVGGLRWVRFGRVSVAVCVSREFRRFGFARTPARRNACAAQAVERIRARIRRQGEAVALGRACAVTFACVVVAGLPLVLGGVL